MFFREQYKQMAHGLHVLLDETRKYTASIPKKVEGMQNIYLQKNSGLYSQQEKQKIQYYLRACDYKFYLATLSLEQLWALSHTKRDEVFNVLENRLSFGML